MKLNNVKICAICGNPIVHYSSKEHFFPQAVYKWHSLALTNKEAKQLRKYIYHAAYGNVLWTHEKCNYSKQDKFTSIDKLHISSTEKDKLKKLKKLLTPALKHYRRLKLTNYIQQNHRCYKCKKKLKNYNAGILRRKKPKKPRSFKNSCLVCSSCNNRYSRF